MRQALFAAFILQVLPLAVRLIIQILSTACSGNLLRGSSLDTFHERLLRKLSHPLFH
jgi:hypothetical protein